MNTTKVMGAILLLVGILVLAYQGVRDPTRESVVDIGPLHVTTEKTNTFPVQPVSGLLAMASGMLLVVFDSRRKA